jgi:AbiV family abortive infection protein
MPSEEILREAAAASFDNAHALYEEAGLLYERDKFARSAALAVLGAEEFAKSVIYLVAALMPEQHHLLPARLEDHGTKHRAGDAAQAAEIMNEDGWAVQRSEGYPVSIHSRLADMAVGIGVKSCNRTFPAWLHLRGRPPSKAQCRIARPDPVTRNSPSF